MNKTVFRDIITQGEARAKDAHTVLPKAEPG